jgi:hypothetical protein
LAYLGALSGHCFGREIGLAMTKSDHERLAQQVLL